MPLVRARVRDFQSIADTGVDFGRFTVLVGPSNSGKSAFLRALRACLRNTIVPGNVRQGTSKAVIDVEFDNGIVQIERGKSLSTYRLDTRYSIETYTKSGRTVPDEVAAFIALPTIGGAEATFAFQFDKPFLLAEPGSQVAGVIGTLTNVSMLHSAVRETNRRRSEAAHLLRTRTADALDVVTRLDAYADLPARRATLTEAEDRFAALQQAQERLAALDRHIATVRTAEAALEAVTPMPPPNVHPRLDGLAASQQRLTDLTRAADRVRDISGALRKIAARAREYRDLAAEATADLAHAIAAQPTCPTCGQPIQGDRHERT